MIGKYVVFGVVASAVSYIMLKQYKVKAEYLAREKEENTNYEDTEKGSRIASLSAGLLLLLAGLFYAWIGLVN